jgi:hypothetical protein
MASGAVLEEEGYNYEGPLDLAKGDGTAKDQLNSQNDSQQQAFKSQLDTLNSLKSSLSGYLSGNQGFTGQQMSTMTSQALNQNSQKYAQAGNQTRQALGARGISGSQTPGGGATAGTLAGLYGAQASDQSNAINTINLQNSQQALNNQFNAAGVLSGNAQTLGGSVGTFGSGASNALNQYVSASNQGFGAAFTKALGGSLGAGIGAMATGGMGTAMSGGGGSAAPSMLDTGSSGYQGYGGGINAPGMSAGGGNISGLGWMQ